jgi:EmrB/QacA subfamily drug resistance transporter
MSQIPARPRSFWRKWTPIFVLSLGLAIIIIDTTLLNVSFSNLIRDLNTDIQSLQWVITAYALTLAALTITGGRLGDLWGRKKMFVAGAAIFAVGSFVASISNSVSTMIIGESIIEGIGAALMMPATLSLLVSTYKGRDRAIAMGMWGGVAGAASAIGPILGGYLTSHYSWRWGFRINIFVVAILILGSFVIKECRDEKERPSLDSIGAVLSSVGLLGLVFGIIESSKYGWWRAKEVFLIAGHAINLGYYSIVPLSMLIGLMFLVAFILWEKRISQKGGTPIVSMDLFKNRQFVSGLVTTSVMAIGQAGIIFSFPIFFQAVKGLDAYRTGMAFLPMSLTALVVAPLSSIFLSKKLPPKRLVQIGLLVSISALFVLRSALKIDADVSNFIPGMIMYGTGMGLMMAQISNLTLSAVSVDEAGEASGVNNTFRQIGSALGSAVIGAVLLTALSTNLVNGINDSRVIPARAKQQIAEAVSAQTSNVEFGGGAKITGSVSPRVSSEITKISYQATTDSNRLALIYAIAFTILGFLTSFALPNAQNVEKNQSAPTTH